MYESSDEYLLIKYQVSRNEGLLQGVYYLPPPYPHLPFVLLHSHSHLSPATIPALSSRSPSLQHATCLYHTHTLPYPPNRDAPPPYSRGSSSGSVAAPTMCCRFLLPSTLLFTTHKKNKNNESMHVTVPRTIER